MFIVVHRTDVFEIQEIFGEIVASLLSSDILSPNTKVTRSTIDIGDIRIDFRCSDMFKMAGLRPDYFNTDSEEVAHFLQLMADKVNGKEIKDISEIINMIKGAKYGNSRSNTL